MAIDIAELRVLADADTNPAHQKLDKLDSRLDNYGSKEFKDAQVDVDIRQAEAKLETLRKSYRALQKEMNAGGTTSAANTGAGGVANAVAVAGAQTERQAKATAAKVEGIQKVSNAKIEAAATQSATKIGAIEAEVSAKTQSIKTAREVETNARIEGMARLSAQRQADYTAQAATRSASRIATIEAESATRREQSAIASEQRQATAVDRIRAEAAARQQVRDEMAAKRQAAMTPSQQWSQTGKRLERAGQNNVQSGAMLSGMVTAPIAGALYSVGKAGIDWQSAFADVHKNVDGSAAQLRQLELQLRAMAAGKGAIPIPVEQLAGIAANAGALGVNLPEIPKFALTNARIATTTNMSSEDAGNFLARFANATGAGQDSYDRTGSTLLALGRKSPATESEIAAMALRIAGAGRQVNMTQPQILGLSSSLSGVGVESEAGGTAISHTIEVIDKAVRQGGENLKNFAAVSGETAKNFKKEWQTDAAGALVSFIEGLKRIHDAGGSAAGTLDALELKDRRVHDALLRASNAGDLFNQTIKIGVDAWRENTALADEAGKRYETTASQIQIFQNRIKELALSLSDKLGPALNGAIKTASDTLPGAIGRSVDAFMALPDPVKKTLIGLTALVALAGPTQMLAGNVQLLAGAAATLGAAALANPVGALIALAAVAGAYVILGGAFQQIADAQAQMTQTSKDLGVSFDHMGEALSAVKLPENSQLAGKIQKLREECAGAGTDVGKLDKALADVTALKHEVQLGIKNPDVSLVTTDALNQIQSLLNKQKVIVQYELRPDDSPFLRGEEWTTQKLGITKPERPVTDMTGRMNNFTDLLTGQGWNGDAGTGEDMASQGELAEWRRAREKGSAYTKRLRAAGLAAARRQQAQDLLNLQKLGVFKSGPDWTANHDIGLPGQVFTAPGVKPAAPAPIQSNALLDSLGITKSNTDLLNTLKGYNVGKPGQVFTAPGAIPPLENTPENVAAAWARLRGAKPAPAKPQGTPNITTGDLDSGHHKKTQAEKDAEAAQRLANRIAERARSQEAQQLDKEAQAYNSIREDLLSMVARMGDLTGATDTARLKARLMAEEFAAIPQHLKTATLEISALVEKSERLTQQRDAMRGQNNATFSKLLASGADTKALEAAIKAQEAAFGYGPKLADARGKIASLGSWLDGEFKNRGRNAADRADTLRDMNALDGRTGKPSLDLKGAVSSSQVLEAAKAVSQSQMPGFKQTCAWAVSRMYDAFGIEIKTQNNNWAANLVAYARQHWRQVDAASAPPGALLAEHTGQTRHRDGTASSGWHVSMSRGGLNRAGSNLQKLQLGKAGAGAIAFMPPELETASSAPAHQSGGADPDVKIDFGGGVVGYGPKSTRDLLIKLGRVKGVAASALPTGSGSGTGLPPGGVKMPPGWVELQNQLLLMNRSLLKGWGPMVNERNIQPGESRSFRLQEQQNILDEQAERKAKGQPLLTPAQLAARRGVSNTADWATATVQATDAVTQANKAFSDSEGNKVEVLTKAREALKASGGSMAAYERALYLAQQEADLRQSDAYTRLQNQKRPKEAEAFVQSKLGVLGANYDAQKGADADTNAVSALTEQAQALETLNRQYEVLKGNAGQPEAKIALELDLVTRRQEQYFALLRSGKTKDEAAALADQWAVGERVNTGIRDRIDLIRRLAAAQLQAKENQASQRTQAELLADPTKNRGEREREAAKQAAMRAKAEELKGAIATGQISPNDAGYMVFQAGQDAVNSYNAEARNGAAGDSRSSKEAHDRRMESLGNQKGIMGRYGANDPQLNIELQLEERRAQLRERNADAVNGATIDVEAQVKSYKEELEAQAEIERLSRSRQNAAQAEDAVLEARKQRELLFVQSARERLAIEFRYQQLLNHGVPVSDEEKRAQGQLKDIAADTERIQKVQSLANQMRDSIAGALKDGANKGVMGMVTSFAKGLSDMVRQAALNRMADGIVGKILGQQYRTHGQGDLFDAWNARKGPQSAGNDSQGVGDDSNQPRASGVHLNGFKRLAGIVGFAPPKEEGTPAWLHGAGALLGGNGSGWASVIGAIGGKGGGDKGQRIESAVIHITNATEHIQTATINAKGLTGADTGTGPGSSPSGEQMVTSMFGGILGFST